MYTEHLFCLGSEHIWWFTWHWFLGHVYLTCMQYSNTITFVHVTTLHTKPILVMTYENVTGWMTVGRLGTCKPATCRQTQSRRIGRVLYCIRACRLHSLFEFSVRSRFFSSLCGAFAVIYLKASVLRYQSSPCTHPQIFITELSFRRQLSQLIKLHPQLEETAIHAHWALGSCLSSLRLQRCQRQSIRSTSLLLDSPSAVRSTFMPPTN